MVPMVTKVEPVEIGTRVALDGPKKERGRNWTDMEVNLFAAILVDDNYNFALSLENLATKKSSNKDVLTHIKSVFDQALEEAQFKGTTLNKYFPTDDGMDNFEPLDTSPEKLRKKYNNLKAEWRKRTERLGDALCLEKEPRWFSLLNTVFVAASETSSFALSSTGSTSFTSSADHKRRHRGIKRSSETSTRTTKIEGDAVITLEGVEYREKDRPMDICDIDADNVPTSANMISSGGSCHISNLLTEIEDGNTRRSKSQGLTRRSKYGRSQHSSHRSLRVGTPTRDITRLACGVKDLAASLLEIKQISLENERKRDEMFLKFFAEEAEKARVHELRLAEIYASKSPASHSVASSTQAARAKNTFPKPRRRSILFNYNKRKRTLPPVIHSNHNETVVPFPDPTLTIDNLYPAPSDNEES